MILWSLEEATASRTQSSLQQAAAVGWSLSESLYGSAGLGVQCWERLLNPTPSAAGGRCELPAVLHGGGGAVLDVLRRPSCSRHIWPSGVGWELWWTRAAYLM